MGCATAIQSQKETKVISRVLDPWLSLRKHRMEGDAKHPGGTKQTFPLLSWLKKKKKKKKKRDRSKQNTLPSNRTRSLASPKLFEPLLM